MPPKAKGKKGKKAGDDDYWDEVGESVPSTGTGTPRDDDAGSSSTNTKSAFALLADESPAQNEPAEEDEDFGGLMSAIKANSKGKKEKKKPKKSALADVDDADVNGDGEPSKQQDVTQVTADDLADEEWGPVKDKKSKGGKKGKKAQEDEEEAVEKADDTAPTAAAEDDPAASGEPKILSKKEKEKLKKEKEKAKKKAAAAAKKESEPKAEATEAPKPDTSSAAPAEPKEDGEDGEGDGEGGASAAAKKKKKKKGAKKDEEPAAAPAAAAPKKGGKISALKALMDEKKRIEEEARKKAEEERLRIEEEDRLAEEAEKKKEAERLAKKEREKAKKEIAKKEGRLLTPKQKAEKAAAEARKAALLASGAVVEGLREKSEASPAPKKISYGNKKKKGGPAAGGSAPSEVASPAPSTQRLSPETVPSEPPESETKTVVGGEEDVKSDWEADTDEDKPVAATPAEAEVKDSWEDSSENESAAKPQPVTAPAKSETKSKAAVPPKKEAKEATTTKPAVNGKAQAPPPSKKEAEAADDEDEDDEDEDDSDDSEDDDDSDEGSSEEESSDEELTAVQRQAAQRKAEAAERRAKAHEAALAARNKDDLRSPICCILGHVDTGKTKLLDKIRQTNVQEGEAGGITQQIGATFFPVEAIKQKTAVLNKDGKREYKIPGLLVIDTPGHESFTNLRTRGSSLCNIAILVVDIMHGLEPQTLESLRLLRDKKTPFVVALNKIDRIYGWKAIPDNSFQDSLAKQTVHVQREFADRVEKTILAFAEQGLNSVLYYENKSFAKNVSLVPTSAVTGEGVPDMIMLLVSLTQERMNERLMYLSELECTVLEVKVIEGLGTTIDVVLSNGILREGDRIVVCGLNGPIVTQVRALLTPQPLRELRIKSVYVHHKEVKAALGVKITAPDLEKAIAGSRLMVIGPDDDEDDLKEEIMSDLTSLLNSIDKSGRGVCVQASTLGSLEALLDFLSVSKIPVSGINIGPVHKKDIMRSATMLEKARELACILCFDVPVDKEAEKLAEEMGIRIFKADIIYHLFDAFTAYNAEILEAKRKDAAPQAVWPCRLKIIAAFCKRDPIIVGVDILDGTLRIGTPICVVKADAQTGKKEIIPLGKVTSLEINHKNFELVKKSQAGGGVAVKIEHAVYQSAKMFGRHFDDKDVLLSHISRASIDVLKSTFKEDVSKEEWQLIKGLKPLLNIP